MPFDPGRHGRPLGERVLRTMTGGAGDRAVHRQPAIEEQRATQSKAGRSERLEDAGVHVQSERRLEPFARRLILRRSLCTRVGRRRAAADQRDHAERAQDTKRQDAYQRLDRQDRRTPPPNAVSHDDHPTSMTDLVRLVVCGIEARQLHSIVEYERKGAITCARGFRHRSAYEPA